MKTENKNILIEKLEKAYANKQISTAEYEMWQKVYGIMKKQLDTAERKNSVQNPAEDNIDKIEAYLQSLKKQPEE